MLGLGYATAEDSWRAADLEPVRGSRLPHGRRCAARRGAARRAVSKGSHGRRVKFFRFSTDTATLLRRYIDGERRSHDRTNLRLADYLRAGNDKLTDLNEVPLFLSTRGMVLTRFDGHR